MIKYLENLLYEKTKDSQSEILYAQWNYDKKVIPSALNSVSVLFPHYSLHDESHSITIINNIVRVLGKDKLEKLTAIDIWLILEASYCHDIGMVVSSAQILESINTKDFLIFFKELLNDTRNGLFEFANLFEIKDGKISYKSNILNMEAHDGFKFILAEFFRRQHADRSKDIILNPTQELKITTPRGVIPQRIFKILADICASHTKNFEDVMKLPFCEVGIDVENSHPRFISCMLRIGDLLDLDNNRFSEVMLRTLSKIPVDTLTHKAKHLSIESFRVDNEKIEVFAKCFDYESANVTQHWFNYLNSEISSQMINWNDIVPFKEFGYLPTIGKLEVELKDYDYIDGKRRPKFSVDTEKALELLKGAGLYDGPYQSIREILQNSVDATLLRIWLDHSHELDKHLPQSDLFKEIARKYTININIIDKGTENNKKTWEISIQDSGIGISSYDLGFLMNTGSSSKNTKKIELIDSMPDWMRPSGTFGIGFQSIFMLSTQIKIETKSYFTEQFQFIELNSPTSDKDGGVLIQKKKTNHHIKPGTTITFSYQTDAIPNSWSLKSRHKTASKIANNYDPFLHDSLDINIGEIVDEVIAFANKCSIPIELTLANENISTQQENNHFAYFDKETSLELSIGIPTNYSGNAYFYYKGQEIDENHSTFCLNFNVNLHRDKASEVLKLNRNEFNNEYQTKFNQIFLRATFRIIIQNFNEIFKTKIEKIHGSLYLHYYKMNYLILKGFDISQYNQWEKHEIEVIENEKKKVRSLKELVSYENIKLVYNTERRINFTIRRDKIVISKKTLILYIERRSPDSKIVSFIISVYNKQLQSIILIQQTKKQSIIEFTKQASLSNFPESEYLTILKSIKDKILSTRAIIPCLNKYSSLRIKDNAKKNYVHHYYFDHLINLKYPKMVSPFILLNKNEKDAKYQINLNENLYHWVYDKRYRETTTLEEIKQAYEDFIKEFKLEDLNA